MLAVPLEVTMVGTTFMLVPLVSPIADDAIAAEAPHQAGLCPTNSDCQTP